MTALQNGLKKIFSLSFLRRQESMQQIKYNSELLIVWILAYARMTQKETYEHIRRS